MHSLLFRFWLGSNLNVPFLGMARQVRAEGAKKLKLPNALNFHADATCSK